MSGQAQLPLVTATGQLTPVAAYVRMSQSTSSTPRRNQLDRIKEFAARRGMENHPDLCRRGEERLEASKGRDSLRSMIAEVETGQAQFPRASWPTMSAAGPVPRRRRERFTMNNILQARGIAVHYCAEQFENDGSTTSNIIKSVSVRWLRIQRELSTKVFQGPAVYPDGVQAKGALPAMDCAGC